MIKTEFYMERRDGVKLYRTYSDKSVMIQKDGTDKIYREALDVEDSGFIYTETDIPINHGDSEEASKEDLADALNKLGVDTND